MEFGSVHFSVLMSEQEFSKHGRKTKTFTVQVKKEASEIGYTQDIRKMLKESGRNEYKDVEFVRRVPGNQPLVDRLIELKKHAAAYMRRTTELRKGADNEMHYHPTHEFDVKEYGRMKNNIANAEKLLDAHNFREMMQHPKKHRVKPKQYRHSKEFYYSNRKVVDYDDLREFKVAEHKARNPELNFDEERHESLKVKNRAQRRAADRAAKLGKVAFSGSSQLNGSHGEHTNEDDVVVLSFDVSASVISDEGFQWIQDQHGLSPYRDFIEFILKTSLRIHPDRDVRWVDLVTEDLCFHASNMLDYERGPCVVYHVMKVGDHLWFEEFLYVRGDDLNGANGEATNTDDHSWFALLAMLMSADAATVLILGERYSVHEHRAYTQSAIPVLNTFCPGAWSFLVETVPYSSAAYRSRHYGQRTCSISMNHTMFDETKFVSGLYYICKTSDGCIIEGFIEGYEAPGSGDNFGPFTGMQEDEAARLYRKLSVKYHPDKGGNPEDFIKLVDTYEKFKEALADRLTNPPEMPDVNGEALTHLIIVIILGMLCFYVRYKVFMFEMKFWFWCFWSLIYLTVKRESFRLMINDERQSPTLSAPYRIFTAGLFRATGGANRRSVLNNRGVGSKSKQRRGPLPPAGVVVNPRLVEQDRVDRDQVMPGNAGQADQGGPFVPANRREAAEYLRVARQELVRRGLVAEFGQPAIDGQRGLLDQIERERDRFVRLGLLEPRANRAQVPNMFANQDLRARPAAAHIPRAPPNPVVVRPQRQNVIEWVENPRARPGAYHADAFGMNEAPVRRREPVADFIGIAPNAQAELVGEGRVAEELEVLEESDNEREEDVFIVSDPPNVQKLHHTNGLPVRMMSYDCQGSPFCGLTCIDTAVGKTPSYDSYAELVVDMNDVFDEVGTVQFLRKFALSRGVNIAVYQRVDGRFNLIYSAENSTGFRWCLLEFIPSESELINCVGDLAPTGEEAGQVGHFVLICSSNATPHNFRQAPEMGYSQCFSKLERFCLFLFLWAFVCVLLSLFDCKFSDLGLINFLRMHWIVTLFHLDVKTTLSREHTLMESEDTDVRGVVSRRDKMLFNDTISVFAEKVEFGLLGWWFPTFVTDLIRWGDSSKPVHYVYDVIFAQVAEEMEMLGISGRDVNLALGSINKFREVNSRFSRVRMITATARYLKLFGETLDSESIHPDLSGMVHYNVPNDEVALPDLDVVAANQRNVRGGSNRVIRSNLRTLKRDRPVAVAPMGAFATNRGILGPGNFSLTDDVGTFVAFTGRSMCKEDTNKNPVIEDFLVFSLRVIDKILESVDLTGLTDDCANYFKIHYKDIKSASFIRTNLEKFERFRSNLMSRKEEDVYKRHGAFVKFESNVKVVNGKNLSKPRLIMTMSDHLLMTGCPVIQCIHRFNEGIFGRFQVKGMEPSEMAARVVSALSRDHVVTDYSSFESSVNETIRSLEMHALDRMCLLANLPLTRAAIKPMAKGRLLHTGGNIFEIKSRCSGDFWTSFGNGLVNGLICMYQHHLKGIDVLSANFLVEGDDGIMPLSVSDPEIVKDLGFKFSDSQVGHGPGDTDFLKNRWVDGKRYLPVGKFLGSCWVKAKVNLARRKQLYILRCMGSSLHALSPGHPVLSAVVNKIGELTSGKTRAFRNAARYLDPWKGQYVCSKYPDHVVVDESMRALVATGAPGFPPLSVSDQLELEERIGRDGLSAYIGHLFDDSDDVQTKIIESRVGLRSDLTGLIKAINCKKIVVESAMFS